MIACVCRDIHEEDYPDTESLRARIMQSDWHCGLCQLRYELDIAPVAEWSNASACKADTPS
jgi:hypothetical protein